VNPAIFREYDIRGLVDIDLTAQEVFDLGRGLGTYFRGLDRRRLVVGRDCRPSSEEFSRRLIEALLASGCDVIDIGVNPTPVLYFSVRHFQAQGGVMVTASHNPPEFNGFKICRGFHTIFGAEIQRLREITQQGQFTAGQGKLERREVVRAYLDHLAGDLKITRPLRLGMDGGHGTAGPVAQALFQELGCQVWPLYCEMDGRFPAHLPDPTVEANLSDLKKLVQDQQLDLGVAYDGDGDRLGVVGPRGEVIWGDQLLILFARAILQEKPGATIIGEVKCSQRMYEDIERHGGRAIMWKTGHSLIKQKMQEEEAMLAGEMSGHLFFADRYFGYDDAIYATGRLLELLTGRQTLTELLADLPPAVVTPEIRRDCPDGLKFRVVEGLKARLAGRFPFLDIDGVRLTFPDGWGLVRASNTQPALVLRFEAGTPERLQEIRALVEELLSLELAAQGGA
jgi:phosphomannomutase / phosphoglucomutase